MPLDENTLQELKLSQARFFQQMWASQYAMHQQRSMHEAQKEYLAAWESWLLPLAQRYENNPVQFCETVMGQDWFTPPEDVTTQQVRELLKMSPDLTKLFTAPVDLSKVDGKMLLKRLQTFTAKPPGRKPSEEFGRALELKRAGKNIHEICFKLVADYEKMGSVAQRVAHQRIRSGISRLEQKEKDGSQRSRNTLR
jgi:hypothetical protein